MAQSTKYPQVKDGQRVRPIMRGYRMACCDCKLVHDIDFYVVRLGRGHTVEFRFRRNNRATAAMRRKRK